MIEACVVAVQLLMRFGCLTATSFRKSPSKGSHKLCEYVEPSFLGTFSFSYRGSSNPALCTSSLNLYYLVLVSLLKFLLTRTSLTAGLGILKATEAMHQPRHCRRFATSWQRGD